MRGSVEKRSSLIHFDYLTPLMTAILSQVSGNPKIGGYDQLGGS
jgi:hypothetical protein